MSKHRIMVLKFGGSVLGSERDLPNAVSEVYRWIREGFKVVVAASAYYGYTDRLVERANRWGIEINPHAAAELIATGEMSSCSELTLALSQAGLNAHYLTPRAAGMLSVGDVVDSLPISLKVTLVEQLLETNDVVVIPGFIACDALGATNLLGRGGSDLSALFFAYRLRAEHCRLLKDIDGLYEWDPKKDGPAPRCFENVTWERALQLEKDVLQPKALDFAKAQNMAFSFACIGAEVFTTVGAPITSFRAVARPTVRRRITLLGLGTVGGGVYERLSAQPDKFDVVAVSARHPEKHPEVKVFTDPFEALKVESDIVIELIGGLEPATELMQIALESGRHVVTGNKAAVGQSFDELSSLAKNNGVELRFSAAVGGVVPMLERTRLAASEGIESIRGVINGCTNYVIDRVLHGQPYDETVKQAIEIGFAEANPTTDLGGFDAAHKLSLLTRTAFGEALEIEIEGIENIDWAAARQAFKEGVVLRLVAQATRNSATVRPEFLPAHDPLAQATGPGNVLAITKSDGETEILRGLGAGRFPTTEAVMADLYDILRIYERESATALVPA